MLQLAYGQARHHVLLCSDPAPALVANSWTDRHHDVGYNLAEP